MGIIAYYRVSTKGQGESGLGLEGQERAVADYARRVGKEVVASYREVESGKIANRPELKKAMAHARCASAVLVVAKLDRLSRDPDFLGEIMKSETDFVACDMPAANKLTIRIMAAVAEQEREAISARTKAALAAYKARGGKLGASLHQCRNLTQEAREKGSALAAERRTAEAESYYQHVLPMAEEMRERGATLREIADDLNSRHYRTRRQKAWSPMQVSRVLAMGA